MNTETKHNPQLTYDELMEIFNKAIESLHEEERNRLGRDPAGRGCIKRGFYENIY